MDPNERKGWMEIISARDLDEHMAAIGQAEANASIVKQMFAEHPLKGSLKLLVPGCGTGQLFDFIRPDDLGKDIEFMFADIKKQFISKLEERLGRFPGTDYETQVDDIEKTDLKGNYDGILIVLVLQHVEWKKALESMLGLKPARFYIIIQEQDPTQHAVTKGRKLAEVWRKYAELANPELVPRAELVGYLAERKYGLIGTYEKQVPDNKTMTGLVFEKKA